MTLPVLIVEDHPLFRSALASTVQAAGLAAECVAVGSAAQARALWRPGVRYALALIDQRLPDGLGLRLAQEARAWAERCVLLTGAEEPGLAQQARQLGLDGFIPKSLPPEALVAALRRVLRGEPWYPDQPTAAATPLTERQRQVLREVGRGRSNREIAERLGISERTVKEHLSVVFIRLGTNRRAEAIAQATSLGLIDFEGEG
ncbi:response regulator transcription factor [Ideonella sp. 4Y11]|uniref:Response regulator transcription factor n=1 Tax=Ideonella aquatica TaxID=2824119 RepID=A0A940YDL5_9BURK|nr:response regulator transcription factor [Ideonella aquatica]MBQ0958233.1 response regulator transcription factor [Ideonella aquatica]